MNHRGRRIRSSRAIRALVRETVLDPRDFVQPFFVLGGKKKREEIRSMPGIYRWSPDNLLKEIEGFIKLGGKAGLFFGIPAAKDKLASEAYAPKGVIQQAVAAVKDEFPEFLVITDVCLCSYTDHGHCGIVVKDKIDNDRTLPVLAKVALSHAQAGADIVAPSDMMDGRVEAIRETLDKAGFGETPVMSYAVKYNSAFYGPFREAADSSPQFADRKTYQMDYANRREALKEAKQDILEGADIIMVKPALAYLDIIADLRQQLNVPIAAYCVSGEYSMIKAASANGWINEKDVVLESLTAVKRAGADIVITYYAKDLLVWLREVRS